MNALYNFCGRPAAWIAFTVCIGGMIWRLWSGSDASPASATPRPSPT